MIQVYLYQWLFCIRIRLYRYVTRTNVSFFDPSPNLVFRSKNGTFVRVIFRHGSISSNSHKAIKKDYKLGPIAGPYIYSNMTSVFTFLQYIGMRSD